MYFSEVFIFYKSRCDSIDEVERNTDENQQKIPSNTASRNDLISLRNLFFGGNRNGGLREEKSNQTTDHLMNEITENILDFNRWL